MSAEGPTSKVLVSMSADEIAAEQKQLRRLVRMAQMYRTSCSLNGDTSREAVQLAKDLSYEVEAYSRKRG